VNLSEFACFWRKVSVNLSEGFTSFTNAITMTKPKFYLDANIGADGKFPILISYSYNGLRIRYFPGISIKEKFYQPECNKKDKTKPIRATAPYAVIHNQRLFDIALSMVTIVNNNKTAELTRAFVVGELDKLYKTIPEVEQNKVAIKQPETTFTGFLENLIEETRSGKRLLKKGKNKGGAYSDSTIRNYEKTLKAIKRYLVYAKKRHLTFDQINAVFYNKFRGFCFKVENKEVSTFSGFIKDIKTVMSEAPTMAFNPNDFICPTYETDDIALTLDQIEMIARCDLSDYSKTFRYKQGAHILAYSYEELDRIRDEFIIGCYSGLRFSDLNSLTIERVEEGFIRVKQIKTGERVTIPVMDRLKPYILKYSNELPSTPYFRFLTGAKEVARLAGLINLIEVRNNKGNQVNLEMLELWTQIGTHTCRRSYATNMFKAGVPTLLIMGATGHTTEKSFLKYIKATNEDKARLLADQYLKLNL